MRLISFFKVQVRGKPSDSPPKWLKSAWWPRPFWSRLSRGLEHGGVHCFARTLAGPDYELERRKVAFAGIERGAEHRLALPVRCGDAAGKNQRMTEHHHAGLRPDVEMSDPQLLVHEPNELRHAGQPRLRYLHVEGAGQVQRLDVTHPGEGNLVVGPAPGDDEPDLVFAGAFERPIVPGHHALDHVERMVVRISRNLDEGHAASTVPPKGNRRVEMRTPQRD